MRLVPDLSPVGWFLFGAMVLLILTYLYFWWMVIKASAHKHVSREKVTLEVVEAFLTGDSKDAAGIRRKVVSEPHLPYHGIFLHIDSAPEPAPASRFANYLQFATPLESDHMPTRSPRLPDGFTDLWLVGRKFNTGWRWNQEMGWSFVQAPLPLYSQVE